MITDEQRKYITLFRLEGLRLDWSVYFAFMADPSTYLDQCREDLGVCEYFRCHSCNLLSTEMEWALKELNE